MTLRRQRSSGGRGVGGGGVTEVSIYKTAADIDREVWRPQPVLYMQATQTPTQILGRHSFTLATRSSLVGQAKRRRRRAAEWHAAIRTSMEIEHRASV